MFLQSLCDKEFSVLENFFLLGSSVTTSTSLELQFINRLHLISRIINEVDGNFEEIYFYYFLVIIVGCSAFAEIFGIPSSAFAESYSGTSHCYMTFWGWSGPVAFANRSLVCSTLQVSFHAVSFLPCSWVLCILSECCSIWLVLPETPFLYYIVIRRRF